MIVLDVECYRHYWMVSLMDIKTNKVRVFEKYDGQGLDRKSLGDILTNFTTLGFNSLSYDLPMITAALMGFTNDGLKNLSDKLITSKQPHWAICRDMEIDVPVKWDHVDVIEVAPGQASLKIYGGRLHSKTLQDLPYTPDHTITEAERVELRKYCVNDLVLTKELYLKLEKQIALRAQMSEVYGMDLRSKSDAQIAETVIKSELNKITGLTYRAPKLPANYNFKYKDPLILSFESKTLKEVFSKIKQEDFKLAPTGSVLMPTWLKKERIVVAGREYQMGIGGLHSCEKRQFVEAKDDYILEERDVVSYYPNIIIQQQLAPENLGVPFLKVYQSIVDRRVAAKKAGDKVTSDTLKISVNGSFGKLGSKYSSLYSPDLLIQTTVTGQLALLMLIERLTAAGVEVVSANTDGVVLYYKKDLALSVEDICFNWCLDTSYELETTPYRRLASRDVNNYIAVGTNGKVKGKGIFADTGLSKNPNLQIVTIAAALQVSQGVDYIQTVRNCTDITKFVCVRRVTGGAVWGGNPIGKTVRFYMSNTVPATESILYEKNGNRVPKSAGARPLMVLPDKMPADVDYNYYEVEAEKLLAEIGYKWKS